MPLPVNYIKSAVHPVDFPETSLPEVAVAGRSNAGKSSLINLWTGSKIAHVSKTAGKTRLLNFFEVRRKYILVDMPGYGFASRSNSEVKDWQTMVENYLFTRKNLCGLILVMDMRREWTEDEEMLKSFCSQQDIPITVALTKSDKLAYGRQKNILQKMKQQAGLLNVFPCSTLSKKGIEDLEEFVFESWLK